MNDFCFPHQIHNLTSKATYNNLNVNPLKFNFPESHILLVHSTLPTVDLDSQKKENYHIPDAASERV